MKVNNRQIIRYSLAKKKYFKFRKLFVFACMLEGILDSINIIPSPPSPLYLRYMYSACMCST